MSIFPARRWVLKFLALGPAVALANDTFAQSTSQDFQYLVSGQYVGVIRLKHPSSSYIGADFKISDSPSDWYLRLGRYQGKIRGKFVDWSGYWIFNPDGRRAWQAQRYNGPLKYWNEDGHAAGRPEDWELFSFEQVDASQQTVRIKNTTPQGGYIGLVGSQFDAQHNRDNAAVFYVEFNKSAPPLPASAPFRF